MIFQWMPWKSHGRAQVRDVPGSTFRRRWNYGGFHLFLFFGWRNDFCIDAGFNQPWPSCFWIEVACEVHVKCLETFLPERTSMVEDMSPMDAQIDSHSSTNSAQQRSGISSHLAPATLENVKMANQQCQCQVDGKCLDQIHLADTPQECNEQNIVQWLAIVWLELICIRWLSFSFLRFECLVRSWPPLVLSWVCAITLLT